MKLLPNNGLQPTLLRCTSFAPQSLGVMHVVQRLQLHPLLTATQEGNYKGTEGFEVQVKDGVRFEKERQSFTVGCEKLQSVLRSCRDKSG